MINKWQDILTGFSFCFSLVTIEEVLSIVLLILSVGTILVKLGIKLYNRIKNNELDKMVNDLEDASEDLQEIKDKLDDNKEDN